MLVFKRKLDETIVIDGGKIVVKITEMGGDWVRVAIDAPREIRIDRGEIHEIRKEQKQ